MNTFGNKFKITIHGASHEETVIVIIDHRLRRKFDLLGEVGSGSSFDNDCETPYFKLKFYKKGSLHITFKDEKILHELNKIGAGVRTDLGYDDFGKK